MNRVILAAKLSHPSPFIAACWMVTGGELEKTLALLE